MRNDEKAIHVEITLDIVSEGCRVLAHGTKGIMLETINMARLTAVADIAQTGSKTAGKRAMHEHDRRFALDRRGKRCQAWARCRDLGKLLLHRLETSVVPQVALDLTLAVGRSEERRVG